MGVAGQDLVKVAEAIVPTEDAISLCTESQ